MKNDYLFRGKRIDNGEWVVGRLCLGSTRWCISMGLPSALHFDVYPESVGQFTGFTDKNGKQIFVGDIVKYSENDNDPQEFIGDIVFECGAFGVGSREQLPIDLDYWCGNDNFVSLWELYWNLGFNLNELPMLKVVGNTYENSDLLKEEDYE